MQLRIFILLMLATLDQILDLPQFNYIELNFFVYISQYWTLDIQQTKNSIEILYKDYYLMIEN